MMRTTREVKKQSAQGRWIAQVMKNGEPVYSTSQYENYIFDEGLDFIGTTYTWAEAFTFCHIGQTVNPTPSTGLVLPRMQNFAQRSSDYYAGPIISPFNFSGCGTEDTGSGLKMRRTFDFPEEQDNTQYTEIGWTPINSASVNTTMFSRIITRSGETHVPIQVLEGQALRVIYELEVCVGPNNSGVGNDSITGLNSQGNFGIQLYGLSAVASGGQSSGQGVELSGMAQGSPSYNGGESAFWDEASGINEPLVSGWGWISEAGEPLATIGNYVERNTGVFYSVPLQAKPYIAGTFTRPKRFFVASESGVHSGYWSIGIGGGVGKTNNVYIRDSGDGPKFNSLAHVLDTEIPKEFEFILNINYFYNWGRKEE